MISGEWVGSALASTGVRHPGRLLVVWRLAGHVSSRVVGSSGEGLLIAQDVMGFPGGSDSEESARNA